MADESRLELIPIPTELSQIYGPIERDLTGLNEYLRGEFEAGEPFVHELLAHIARYRGKQIRPACTFLAARAFARIPPAVPLDKDIAKCAAVVELIHTATLVHDDVLDDASIRRRVETVNERWGERAAVLLGDFIYSRGFSISCEVDGVSKLLADVTHTICEGELLQVGSAFDVDLGEERYYQIILRKTAVLYGMACRLGAMLGGATPDQQRLYEEIGTGLGMAFQIADDALDLVGDERVVGKTLGSDLRKGKLTLPTIRLRDATTGGRRQELLWLLAHPEAVGTQQRVFDMLRGSDVLAGVQETAQCYVEKALALLDRLPENPHRDAFEELGRFILRRDL